MRVLPELEAGSLDFSFSVLSPAISLLYFLPFFFSLLHSDPLLYFIIQILVLLYFIPLQQAFPPIFTSNYLPCQYMSLFSSFCCFTLSVIHLKHSISCHISPFSPTTLIFILLFSLVLFFWQNTSGDWTRAILCFCQNYTSLSPLSHPNKLAFERPVYWGNFHLLFAPFCCF